MLLKKPDQGAEKLQHSLNKLKKKETFGHKVQEYFQCFCRRSYRSFPAFYQHLKSKHDIKLKVQHKEILDKRIKWNGSIKQIFYEIQEDSKKYEENFQDREIQNPKSHSQPSDFGFESQPREKQGVVPEQLRPFLVKLAVGKKQYNTPIPASQFFWSALLNEVYSYYLTKKRKEESSGSQIQSLEGLPLVFNDFVLEHLKTINLEQYSPGTIKQMLLLLSKWLYETKRSPHLAVKNED